MKISTSSQEGFWSSISNAACVASVVSPRTRTTQGASRFAPTPLNLKSIVVPHPPPSINVDMWIGQQTEGCTPPGRFAFEASRGFGSTLEQVAVAVGDADLAASDQAAGGGGVHVGAIAVQGVVELATAARAPAAELDRHAGQLAFDLRVLGQDRGQGVCIPIVEVVR